MSTSNLTGHSVGHSEGHSNSKNPLMNIPLESINQKAFSIKDQNAKLFLFVNTASECGYTPQYKGLVELYDKYKSDGLLVIGIPCNQFGAQEPGAEKEIQNFCEMNFGVQFPLLKKADVKGPKQHPLYKFLIENAATHEEIAWNFEKFLVNKDAQVIGRYKSDVRPEDLSTAIEAALEKSK